MQKTHRSKLPDGWRLQETDGGVDGPMGGWTDGWTVSVTYNRSDESRYIIQSARWRRMSGDRDGEAAGNIKKTW